MVLNVMCYFLRHGVEVSGSLMTSNVE